MINSSCHTPTKEENGKALADKYCSGCHLPVSPALLDKETWRLHVLPAMAPKLGIKVWNEHEYYPPMRGEKPGLISIKDWELLVAYYESAAPEKLPQAKAPQPLLHDWSVFSARYPEMKDMFFSSQILRGQIWSRVEVHGTSCGSSCRPILPSPILPL